MAKTFEENIQKHKKSKGIFGHIFDFLIGVVLGGVFGGGLLLLSGDFYEKFHGLGGILFFIPFVLFLLSLVLIFVLSKISLKFKNKVIASGIIISYIFCLVIYGLIIKLIGEF